MTENPLLHHVRRHQQMPVIFQAAAVSPVVQQPGTTTDVPLVRATLAGQSASPTAELPPATPAPIVAQSAPPPMRASSPPSPPPVQRQSVPPAPTSVPVTQPAMPQPQPTPAQPAPIEERDPAWDRLQAIAHAHQRKQAAESDSPTAEQPAASLQQATSPPPKPQPPQPSPRAAKVLGRKAPPPRMPNPDEKKKAEITFISPDKERPSEQPPAAERTPVERPQTLSKAPAAIQRTAETTTETPPSQPVSAPPAPIPGSERPQPQRVQPEEVEPTVTMPKAAELEDTIVSAPPERPMEEVRTSPPPMYSEPAAQPTEQPPIGNRPQASPAIIQRQSFDEPEQEVTTPSPTEAPSSSPHPTQHFDPETTVISAPPLPAQTGEIHDVQPQSVTPNPTPPDASTEYEPQPGQSMSLEDVWPVQRRQQPRVGLDAPPALPPTQRDSVTERRVRQTLEGVASGRASDSGVELVLPKRPRPVPYQRKSSPTPKPMSRQPETANQPAPIQRQTADPDTVHTEIGPLPGDLWQLLGQAPPSEKKIGTERPSSQTTTQAAAVDLLTQPVMSETAVSPTAPTIQRQVIEEDSPPPPKAEPSRRVETMTAPIQRASIDSGSAGETADGGEAETNGAGKEETGKPEIEELTRQVYQRIKRYLAVERERGRGRF
ncbi:MAG: hypothetical protein WAM60_23250 [Candidatus Promineifilaceae bacterium]